MQRPDPEARVSWRRCIDWRIDETSALQCSSSFYMGKHPHPLHHTAKFAGLQQASNVRPRRTRGEARSLASLRQSSGRFPVDHPDPVARATPPLAHRRVRPKVAPSPLEPRAVPGHSAFGLFARERDRSVAFPGTMTETTVRGIKGMKTVMDMPVMQVRRSVEHASAGARHATRGASRRPPSRAQRSASAPKQTLTSCPSRLCLFPF